MLFRKQTTTIKNNFALNIYVHFDNELSFAFTTYELNFGNSTLTLSNSFVL